MSTATYLRRFVNAAYTEGSNATFKSTVHAFYMPVSVKKIAHHTD